MFDMDPLDLWPLAVVGLVLGAAGVASVLVLVRAGRAATLDVQKRQAGDEGSR